MVSLLDENNFLPLLSSFFSSPGAENRTISDLETKILIYGTSYEISRGLAYE
jgi:hypothetical protein